LDLPAELFRFRRIPQAGLLPKRLKYIAYSYGEQVGYPVLQNCQAAYADLT